MSKHLNFCLTMLLTLTAASGAARANEYALQGFQLGMPYSKLETAFQKECKQITDGYECVVRAPELTIASHRVSLIFLHFGKEPIGLQAASFLFPTVAFDEVKQEASKHFGALDCRSDRKTALDGATFVNESCSRKGGTDSLLVIDQRSQNDPQGSLSLLSLTYLNKRAAQNPKGK